MASRTMAAVVVAAVLLMQCCNVVVTARLLEGDGRWLLQGKGGVAGVGALVMQLLPQNTPGGAGTPNGCKTTPGQTSSGGCH